MVDVPITRERRYGRVELPDSTVLNLAAERLGIPVLSDFEVWTAAFVRRYCKDPASPELLVGTYDDDPKMLELGVLARDERGIPLVKTAVVGYELVPLLAHLVLVFDDQLEQERSRTVCDERLSLPSGETFRFLIRDRGRQVQNVAVVDYRLSKVWGREEIPLFTGERALPPGSSDRDQGMALLRWICQGTPAPFEVSEQTLFRRSYADALLKCLPGA